MDSSYFLISNSTSTTSTTLNNHDFEQSSSSSPFSDDPFDGFPFLDHHHNNSSATRLYDYFNTMGSNGNLDVAGCGTSSSGGDSGISSNGRTSPISLLINQYPTLLHDQLDLHQSIKSTSINSPFHSNGDPTSGVVGDEDDLHGTLLTGAFVGGGCVDNELVVGDCELGVDCDAGYISGVDLFASNNFVDCPDPTEAYYLRLALEQQGNNIINSHLNNNNNNTNYMTDSSGSLNSNCNLSSCSGGGGSYNNICSNNNNNSLNGSNSNSYSDINSNNNYNLNTFINNNNTITTNSNNFNHDWNNFASCINSDSNNNNINNGGGQVGKRSVLMNLLIDGSDIGAGYTSHNCRALPQRLIHH